MASRPIYMVEGDTDRDLKVAFKDVDSLGVKTLHDLTGETVSIHIVTTLGTGRKTFLASIPTPANGEAIVSFGSTDLIRGEYDLEIEKTNGSGDNKTYPSKVPLRLIVRPDIK